MIKKERKKNLKKHKYKLLKGRKYLAVDSFGSLILVYANGSWSRTLVISTGARIKAITNCPERILSRIKLTEETSEGIATIESLPKEWQEKVRKYERKEERNA